MKKELLFLSLLVLSCFFGISVRAQSYPQDLLVDDFNDQDLTMANWDQAIGASGWNTVWSANEGRNGTGCVKILTGMGGFWNTALGPWPVGHKFKISCWVKGTTANSANVIFDIQGVTNKPNFACVDQNGANGRWDTCTVFPLTTEWQLQEATFVTQLRTDPPAFNITVDCNKDLYACVGWSRPTATDASLVDDFSIIDLGPVGSTGVIALQAQPLIYISENELRNVKGLVTVYDIMGRLVIKSIANEGTLSIASLKQGIYIVHANNSAVKIIR